MIYCKMMMKKVDEDHATLDGVNDRLFISLNGREHCLFWSKTMRCQIPFTLLAKTDAKDIQIHERLITPNTSLLPRFTAVTDQPISRI